MRIAGFGLVVVGCHHNEIRESDNWFGERGD